MALEVHFCPNCGAPVDPAEAELGHYICPYCNSNIIDSDDSSQGFLEQIRRAESLRKLDQLQDAYDEFSAAARLYPDRWQGWAGKALCEIQLLDKASSNWKYSLISAEKLASPATDAFLRDIRSLGECRHTLFQTRASLAQAKQEKDDTRQRLQALESQQGLVNNSPADAARDYVAPILTGVFIILLGVFSLWPTVLTFLILTVVELIFAFRTRYRRQENRDAYEASLTESRHTLEKLTKKAESLEILQNAQLRQGKELLAKLANNPLGS